jgi:hypothetical protein
VEWLVRDRWLELVDLAGALDRTSGAKRTNPAITRLRPAAETAGDRVDGIVAAAANPAKTRLRASGSTVSSGAKPRRPARTRREAD